MLDLLPIGLRGFKFLFSGEPESLPPHARDALAWKPFIIPGFALDDTIRYFSDLQLPRELVGEIHRASKGGIPGYLSTARRILVTRKARGLDFTDLPETLPSLFELEWESARIGDSLDHNLVALMAHDRRPHSAATLAHTLAADSQDVANRLRKFSFLTMEGNGQQIVFVSEAYRRFAAKKLETERRRIVDLVINELRADPESRSALLYLPDYLHQAGHFSDLVEYLSPEHISQMVESSQSWRPVQVQTSLGIAAARQLERDSDLLRLGIQESTIVEFEQAATWRPEVEAKMALHLEESALSLAQATIAEEDRLHLLAVISRAKKERKKAIEAELDDQIRKLFARIDKESLGPRGIEIAADLVYSHPDLAIELVRTATTGDQAKDVPDTSLARFSMGMVESTADSEKKQDALAALRKELENPRLKSFSATFSLLFGDYTAEEVIAEVGLMEGIESQISLLRQWCRNNVTTDGALKVVEYGLDQVIRATTYSPNARVYREIATPLRESSDINKSKELVARFHSQRGTTLRLGPTVEHVRLDMILAEAEWKYDRDACKNRLSDSYLYITEVPDAAVRTACLAQMYSTLQSIDADRELELELKLHSSVSSDLNTGLTTLLSQTARQFQATEAVIRSLARTDIPLAASIAGKLNMRARRDKGLHAAIESRCKMKLSGADALQLLMLQNQIEDQDLRDEALLDILYALVNVGSWATERELILQELLDRVGTVEHAGERCRAYCPLISIIKTAKGNEHTAESLYAALHDTWQSINLGWFKIDTGYRIISSLAEHSQDDAKAFLNNVEFARQEVQMDDRITATSHSLCVGMGIRTFVGLLPMRNETDADRDSVLSLILQVPSAGSQALLFSDLAIGYFFSGRRDDALKLVSEHIKPLLAKISELDGDYRAWTIIRCAPAMFLVHKSTAHDFIDELTVPEQDEAFDAICSVILEKVPLAEPYESLDAHEYDLSFEDIRDICDLLAKITSDAKIYGTIEKIADTVLAAQRRHKFSQQQISDITARLRKIAATKFQHPDYIVHEGFVVITEAQIGRIEGAKWPIWERLIRRAEALPNVADIAYVLSVIASGIPGKFSTERRGLLQTAKSYVDKIPTDIDRIERLEILAREASLVDSGFTRECLRAAMAQCITTSEEGAAGTQRRMIDLAHRLDPEFAEKLTALTDTDPAKTKKIEFAQNRLETLKARETLLDTKDVTFEPATVNRYVSAANVVHGQLNARTIGPRRLEDLRRFVELASRLPLRRSHHIVNWILANVVAKYSKTAQAGKYIRPLFDASVLASELAFRIATNSITKNRRAAADLAKAAPNVQSIIIRPGDRDKAVDFVQQWLEQNPSDYIKICDPYFGPTDLELVKILRETAKTMRIEIVTSKQHADSETRGMRHEEAFRDWWRLRVSREEAGDTTIVVVGTRTTGKFAIHDRWWVSRDSGLRVGTSFGSLGLTNECEISVLDGHTAARLEQEVDRYLSRSEREFRGERLLYNVFGLD